MSRRRPATSSSRSRRRDQRGSVSIELVILLPALFAVMFLGMQAALFYHARTVGDRGRAGGRPGSRRRARARVRRRRRGQRLHRRGRRRRRTHRHLDQREPDRHHRHGDRHRVQPERDPRVERPDHAERHGPGRTADRSHRSGRAMIRRDERGSAAIEAAIGVPAFALFVGLIIFGGRTASTHEALQSAAADGARSASLARDAQTARTDAREAATASIANQQIGCSEHRRRRRHHRLQQAARRTRLGRRHRLLPPRPLGSRRARRPWIASHDAHHVQPDRHLARTMSRRARRTRIHHRLAGAVQLRDDLPRRPRRRPRRPGPRPRARPRPRGPSRSSRRRRGRGRSRHPGTRPDDQPGRRPSRGSALPRRRRSRAAPSRSPTATPSP